MGVEILLCPGEVGACFESSRAALAIAALAGAGIATRGTIDRETLRRTLRSLRVGLRIHH